LTLDTNPRKLAPQFHPPSRPQEAERNWPRVILSLSLCLLFFLYFIACSVICFFFFSVAFPSFVYFVFEMAENANSRFSPYEGAEMYNFLSLAIKQQCDGLDLKKHILNAMLYFWLR